LLLQQSLPHLVRQSSEAQLDVQSLHRARSRLVGERTALINQLRAVLIERDLTESAHRTSLQISGPVPTKAQ
jgi:transposase